MVRKAETMESDGGLAHAAATVSRMATKPEFHDAVGSHDPEVRKIVESQVPMKRLGTMEEFASFAMAFLDGSSGFTTGQFVGYAGGWV